ncbi:hypothetical protein TorRG33x02_084690 [Trema orientale]|uniref:Uncharacterized protein n=1 Tax=Trema orientale TaxID=63057 RepID=A0A2P5FCW9_TREOI|nr:hypothetical protein TorRG33x02_084690 [Trema orientale]
MNNVVSLTIRPEEYGGQNCPGSRSGPGGQNGLSVIYIYNVDDVVPDGGVEIYDGFGGIVLEIGGAGGGMEEVLVVVFCPREEVLCLKMPDGGAEGIVPEEKGRVLVVMMVLVVSCLIVIISDLMVFIQTQTHVLDFEEENQNLVDDVEQENQNVGET